MKKRGFTLIELLVVIAIIAMLLAILMPALSKVKKIAQRVVCGTNLKGLGTAQTVYANDYDDEYTVQGRGFTQNWNTSLTGGTELWQADTKIWAAGQQITVGASLYLLVREADVSPKSFVCPSSSQTVFSGRNATNLDIVQLWDFGHANYTPVGGSAEGPNKCVSYSFHIPYAAGQPNATSTGGKGRYAADGSRSAAFAVMADRCPTMDEKLTNGGATAQKWVDVCGLIGGSTAPTTDWINIERWTILIANAQPHDREGQNVLYADGHSSYENRGDVGVKNDYIYTSWGPAATGNRGITEADRRRGLWPGTARDTNYAPGGTEDSVLVNEFILP